MKVLRCKGVQRQSGQERMLSRSRSGAVPADRRRQSSDRQAKVPVRPRRNAVRRAFPVYTPGRKGARAANASVAARSYHKKQPPAHTVQQVARAPERGGEHGMAFRLASGHGGSGSGIRWVLSALLVMHILFRLPSFLFIMPRVDVGSLSAAGYGTFSMARCYIPTGS